MQQQIITPERRPVRRYNNADLEREKRNCAYRVQGRSTFGSEPSSGTPIVPFTPTGVAGLVAWFDMQDAASFTDTGGFVSAITNKASSVSWTEATNRPAYSATGLTGHPCMDFDGTNDLIMSTEAAVVSALAVGNAYTLLYVAAFDTIDRSEALFGAGNSASSNGVRAWGQSSSSTGRWNAAVVDNAALTTEALSTVASNSSAHVHCWYESSSQISHQLDGAGAAPNDAAFAPAATTIDRVALGCRPRSSPTLFFDGKLGELLLYNVRLSPAEIAGAFSYLIPRWA